LDKNESSFGSNGNKLGRPRCQFEGVMIIGFWPHTSGAVGDD